MPKEGYKWNELGKLAKSFYLDHQNYAISELLALFDATFKKILNLVQSETNASSYKIGVYNWIGEKWSLGRRINVNTSSPYKSARTKIRRWKKANSLS